MEVAYTPVPGGATLPLHENCVNFAWGRYLVRVCSRYHLHGIIQEKNSLYAKELQDCANNFQQDPGEYM